MPSRQVSIVVHRPSGLIFGFWPDRANPASLHLTSRHGTTPSDAIATFFIGQTVWNEPRRRFETFSPTHGLYWFWWESDRRVGVISCFPREDL